MDGSNVAKTIAELKVDIENAMTPLSQLQTQFTNLDDQIKQTQANLAGLGKPAATGATGVTAAATATKNFNKEIEKQSVLASQFERKASWFLAGGAWYGGIRAMKEVVSQSAKVESSMVVIQRITNDATFSFEGMRKELMELGKEFGHTWDSVQQVAIRWTQAGYNIADTLELTRLSLLGLNVAEMDLEMATVGLISIMSQWDLQASDLELVIDKLNITSDRYAVTTGDLVAALQRTSGAARALGLSFEDTVGLITATRVASGRLGAEVGNALNTLLAYITRQSTLNKLQEAGINVFADAANTKLRPAMDLLVEISEKWIDTSEQMPMALVEIAEEMGVMSEEMAEMVGLEEEWTQLQKLDIEQSVAGVRRRNFLIALLRNFAMAQEVVVGMHGAEGYSMEQNIQTMETLEKRYNVLKIATTELAVSIGEAGVMGQMKKVVDTGMSYVEWFNKLDSTTKTLIVSFAELAIALKLIRSLLAMGGIEAAGGLIGLLNALKSVPGAIMGAFGGPWGLVATGAGVAIMTIVNNMRKHNTEMETSANNAKKLAGEIEKLKDQYVELAGKVDKTETETQEFKNVTDALTQILPQAISGFDEMGNAITNIATVTETATKRTRELKAEYESFIKAQAAVAEVRIPVLEKELSGFMSQYEILAERTRLGPAFARGPLLKDKGIVEQFKAMFADDAEIMKIAETELKSLNTQTETLRKEITEYESAIKAAEALKDGAVEKAKEPGKTTDPGFPKPDPNVGKEYEKLSDIISKYIETALRAADVQRMLNDETQREMDGLKARIAFYDKENATAWERNMVLQDEAKLRELAAQKQADVHKEADFLREALTKLEQRQSSLNVSTEEGWDAYKRLESQIESIKGTIGSLGSEWFSLGEIVNDNTRAIKEMEKAYKDAISTLDYFNRFGIYTVEQYLGEVNSVYDHFNNLSLEQERDMYSRRFDAYKQMLLDMKREAEDAYRERIKLIDRETEAVIASIQRQIDALDEEAKGENREEERRKHEERLKELQDERQYHELRTGREHSQAIVDIDKRIAEEQRQWELRQAEWVREDKKNELRKEIEDVKDAAQEQKEHWQEVYESMQADFSDHNIALLALASAYDPAYFEDAKNKAQQWIDGFKATLPPTFVANYLKSIVPASVSGIAGGGGGGGDGSSSGGFAYYDKYGYPHVVEDLDTALKYTAGDIDYYTGSYSGGYARDDDGNRIDPFTGGAFPKSHAGSRVVGEGLAELIPGELVFPPDLSIQLQRLISVLSARPLSASQTQQQWRDGGNVEIRGNLLNIENANFEDDTDIEIMSRELRRQVEGLRRR